MKKRFSRPFVLWLTGLSGAGKSTIAETVHKILIEDGHKVEYLDGDALRAILPSTGFTRAERNTHIQRVGFLASRLEFNDVPVVASFISPFEESRRFVRSLCRNYIEVYVSTPLEVCEKRDVKGLYAKARRGEISNFTGISDPYEPPTNPEITIDTSTVSLEDAVRMILTYLAERS